MDDDEEKGKTKRRNEREKREGREEKWQERGLRNRGDEEGWGGGSAG